METTNIGSSHQMHSTLQKCEVQNTNVQIDTTVLVSMIIAKNERGFHLLYDNYCGSLYGILLKLVRRTDVADDLLQDTFIKIWKNIGKFDVERGTLFTWMMNIARNISIDYLRSSGHKQQMLHVNNDFFSIYTEYKVASDSFSSTIEYKDFKSKAMKINAKYAEVIDMVFFFGCTHDQTASILNLPLGTIKTRARKGLDMLKMLYLQ